MAEDDGVVDDIAMCLSQAKSPKNLCSLLGMDNHPVVMDANADKAHPWCACFREVIYHSDNYSLFVQQAPEIELVNHLGDVVAFPPPIVEDTIAGTLEKLAAIEHMITRFNDEGSDVFSCNAPDGCISSLRSMLSQDDQMTFADLSGLGIGDVSASGHIVPGSHSNSYRFDLRARFHYRFQNIERGTIDYPQHYTQHHRKINACGGSVLHRRQKHLWGRFCRRHKTLPLHVLSLQPQRHDS